MKRTGASRLLSNLVLWSLIAMILFALLMMDQKRVRTVKAMKRVEAIHQAILKWQARELAETGGSFADDPPIPDGPEDIAAIDPESAEWLVRGDDYYEYKFSGLRYENAQIYPLVSATARDSKSIVAEVIVSGVDGRAVVGRVSEAAHRFNPITWAKEHPFGVAAFLLLAAGFFWMKLGRGISFFLLPVMAGWLLSCSPSSLYVEIDDPSYPIEAKSFSIRVPPGGGWIQARESGSDMFGPFEVLFVRREPATSHSYYGLVGEMPSGIPFDSPEDFLDYQVNNLRSRIDPFRYVIRRETFDLDDRFGDFSVKYCRMYEDYGSPQGESGGMMLGKTCGYVFLHPYDSELTIRIEFSERAVPSDMDSNFEASASSFFDGLRLKSP